MIELTTTTRDDNCEKHGDFVATLFRFAGKERWSTCVACSKMDKDAETARAQREAAEERDNIRRKAAEARFGSAMIPPRFQDRTLENYEATNDGQVRALRVASRYVEKWDECLAAGRSMLFAGRPGTGKTHLAAAIAHAVMARGSTALFRTVPDAIGIIKASYDGDTTEAKAYDSLVKPDLLVLDEVGATRQSDHDAGVMFRIINARYEHRRPTILITNLLQADVVPILGDRILDRIKDNQGMILFFEWESHRK